MKRVIAIVIGCFVIGSTAVAGELEDNCGCGLGTMVFEGNDSLVFQVLATFTNAIFINQAFGISFGTLGCDQPIALVSNERLNQFVADNMDNLARDIAMGAGESLETVAELVGLADAKKSVFFTRMQENFPSIYTSEKTTHDDIVRAIDGIVAQI